jgi:hypothetical protein
MQFPSRLRTLAPPLLALTLLASPFAALLAQTSGSVKSQSSSSSSGTATPQEAQPQKPPSLIDPAGPQISLQTSEALFDIGAAPAATMRGSSDHPRSGRRYATR